LVLLSFETLGYSTLPLLGSGNTGKHLCTTCAFNILNCKTMCSSLACLSPQAMLKGQNRPLFWHLWNATKPMWTEIQVWFSSSSSSSSSSSVRSGYGEILLLAQLHSK